MHQIKRNIQEVYKQFGTDLLELVDTKEDKSYEKGVTDRHYERGGQKEASKQRWQASTVPQMSA